MMKSERPTAGFGKVARQRACAERMLRTRADVDGHSRNQQLRITADEVLQNRGNADDGVTDSQDDSTFEETGEKAVDDLQTLTDEIRNRREHTELYQPEAKLFHHDGEQNGSNAVLKVV